MKAKIFLLILATAVSCLAETKVDSKQKRFLGYDPIHLTHISSGNTGVATSSVHTHGPAANVLLTVTPTPTVTAVTPVHSNVAYALPSVSIGDASVGHVAGGHYQEAISTAEHSSPGISSGYLPAEAPKEVLPAQAASQENKGPLYSIVYTPTSAAQANKGSSIQEHRIVSSGIQSSVAASSPSTGFGSGLGLEYAAGFQYGAPAQLAHTTTSQITVQQPVPVPVYQPVGITIPRPAPYRVLQPYPVEVPSPVHVSVPHPVPVNVPRPYPVTVNKPYPVTVPKLVPVPVVQPVPVEVPRPYPVHFSYPVPYRLPYPVEVPIATPVVSPAPAAVVQKPAFVAAKPAFEISKPAFEVAKPTEGVSHSSGPWNSAGLGDYASLLSSLNLVGSSYSAPSAASYSLDISPSVEIASSSHSVIGDSSFDFSSGKFSGNLQGPPLKELRGGPSGEKWTGLLTNDYKGTANRFQGFGGSRPGGFRPSKLVGSSLITAGSFSGAGGATFKSNSFKAEGGDDYFPYP
ncbi:mucin-4-like [Ischnura elegans]|uniref:mucin-4-like n=1 Tax=Ischnura elegans TaxID=197161 RepID=UPI001ED8991D|nr:mucin-4-like [Ischnura elegans]